MKKDKDLQDITANEVAQTFSINIKSYTKVAVLSDNLKH